MIHLLTSSTRLWVIGLLACLMLAPATPAAERERETPSARELWEDYPLDERGAGPKEQAAEPARTPSVAPTAQDATASPQAGAGTARESPDGDGSPVPVLLGVGAVLAAVGLGSIWAVRRRSEVRSGPPAVPPPARSSPAAPPQSPVSPPDLGRGWSAEVMWHQGADESRFQVVARAAHGQGETVIGESAALRWPPANQDDIEALSRAADELSAAAIRAGWRPIDPGRAWYAKRFEWSPVDLPANGSGGTRSGRFARGTDAVESSSRGGDSVHTIARGQP